MTAKKNFVFILLVAAIAAVAVVSGFVQQQQQHVLARSSSSTTSTTAVHGIFDKMVKSMESGYAGGDDSPYAKIKEKDRLKELEQKKRGQARRQKGYTELKDVKEKSFVKLKYGAKDEEEEPPKAEKKKLFGLF
eukprot:CAMPEP_0168184426 /NCGR_PEP_ID=MMETSP0139_2-20121125/13225_1 /TAXON_ID=44445 /ORGANISM="Pseudo-nitzschia australis, Strain 10249 10 AB" /LENGTH=133 /DNA_ID=CAMNT_0008106031 /DNA_START=73 /DNA_END=474 /DNA_ORIENTATION=+